MGGIQVQYVTLGNGDIADLIGFPDQFIRADAAQLSRQDGTIIEAQFTRPGDAGRPQEYQN